MLKESAKEREHLKLITELSEIRQTLRSLEKAKEEMGKSIKRLQKEKSNILAENKVLLEGRKEILTILKNNVENIEDSKEQDKIIKLYFTEVEPENEE